MNLEFRHFGVFFGGLKKTLQKNMAKNEGGILFASVLSIFMLKPSPAPKLSRIAQIFMAYFLQIMIFAILCCFRVISGSFQEIWTILGFSQIRLWTNIGWMRLRLPIFHFFGDSESSSCVYFKTQNKSKIEKNVLSLSTPTY